VEPRISIITLGVSSLEKSYQFYTALGFPSSKTPEDGIVFSKRLACVWLYILWKRWQKMYRLILIQTVLGFQVLRWPTIQHQKLKSIPF